MKILHLMLLIGGLTFATGCDVDMTEEGRLPDIDVSAEPGKLPELDVQGPEIDAEMEETEVTVPDIDVTTEKKTVETPDIDIDIPEE